MGNLTNQLPSTISCIILANLALSGFPFLAGFYSKDIIIEYSLSTNFNIFILFITLFRLGLTAFYSMRATIVGIISPKLFIPFINIKEPSFIVNPIIMLSLRAVFIGSIMS
jgi:NADH:ubiquinone oxidoreductase subunit 5 (subunit L)/multisubunit Na+/H+ antiporter MnhA subunit